MARHKIYFYDYESRSGLESPPQNMMSCFWCLHAMMDVCSLVFFLSWQLPRPEPANPPLYWKMEAAGDWLQCSSREFWTLPAKNKDLVV